MTRTFLTSVGIICLALSLQACETARDQLGLGRSAPDEFTVLKQAPLELPPDYNLRPPEPGAPRPQNPTPSDIASQAIFGEQQPVAFTTTYSGDGSTGEQALLEQLGAVGVNPNIRQELAPPPIENLRDNRNVIEKASDFVETVRGTNKDDLIDPLEETRRLQSENIDTGTAAGAAAQAEAASSAREAEEEAKDAAREEREAEYGGRNEN